MTIKPIDDQVHGHINQLIELLYPAYSNNFHGNKQQLVNRISREVRKEYNLGSVNIASVVTSLLCMYEQQKSQVSINLNQSSHFKLVLEFQGQQYTISPTDVFKQIEPLYISIKD